MQNRYNLADRYSQDMLDYCEKEKMGFLPRAPIGGGSGRASLGKPDNSLEAEAERRNYNPVQLALAWLLQKSPVMLPIPRTGNIAHLEENMAAAKIQLSAEEWKKNRSRGLKAVTGGVVGSGKLRREKSGEVSRVGTDPDSESPTVPATRTRVRSFRTHGKTV